MGRKPTKDEPPLPIVRKTQRGLSPVAAYDAELLDADPLNTEYDLAKRARRSLPQLKLYWAALHRVVKATDKWPSAAHLHDELKLICGYRREFYDWNTGELSTILDSISFAKMNADEFKQYFAISMAKLGEHVGFDPIAFTKETP